MEIVNKTSERILMLLVKEPFTKHTATSLANSMGITRQGLWKSINKLSKSNLVVLEAIGNTKKSTVRISPKWKNPLSIKTLSLLLTKESLEYERWRANFAELEKPASFVILFGSIIHSPKEANDIDILAVAGSRNSFSIIDKIIFGIQKTQAKKIHLIDLTEEEFRNELKKQNKAYIDALKKGIVLFGQDNYSKFIERAAGV